MDISCQKNGNKKRPSDFAHAVLQSVLASVCEPVLRPFRRLIPPIAGIDLSPLWAVIAIQAILLLLPAI